MRRSDGQLSCPFCDGLLIWQGDFDSIDDYYYDEAGIISNYTCNTCGTEAEFFQKFKELEEQ